MPNKDMGVQTEKKKREYLKNSRSQRTKVKGVEFGVFIIHSAPHHFCHLYFN